MDRSAGVDKTRVGRFRLGQEPSDFAYWQTRPVEERLAVLEAIRADYIAWKYGAQPRLQRVYRVVKQA
jgi:hypothetical protein